tara:strand:+ start:89803 stop:89946 length:144 start_codon:yes stop_codon:yes gene_type:complete
MYRHIAKTLWKKEDSSRFYNKKMMMKINLFLIKERDVWKIDFIKENQ